MDNATHGSQSEDLQRLRELIKEVDFGMLTTIDADGTLHSRPMSTNGDVEFDGDLWFFTGRDSHKVDEIQANPRVNVSFADPKKQSYVSLSGTAELTRDQEQINRLWKPSHKAWFPEGKEDPNVALLRVTVEKAEFWDAPGSLVARTFAIAKAMLTGQPPADIGENKKLDLAA